MAHQPTFDPSQLRRSPRGRWLGATLFASLVVAVSIAISLAVQLNPESATPEPIPVCGGLYNDCCDDSPARPIRDEGLFDREAEFANRASQPGC